ncbi:MAG: hypothetical protein LBI76_02545 [Comamonas sp.]|nr:hypothetical protein [Comamonas sp.]
MKSPPNMARSPAWVYRLSGMPLEYGATPKDLLEGQGYLKGAKVEASSELKSTTALEVAAAFANLSNYGDRGMGGRCFFPGFAFSFGEDAQKVEVLVCLECNWVGFFWNGRDLWLAPSENGLTQFRKIYNELVERL